jgi:hypothetical protein
MSGEEGATDQARMSPMRFGSGEALVLGVLVSLAIVGPTFLTEETWHGAPLIDRGGVLWLVPAAVMAIGFWAGGIIAGYRRIRLLGALLRGFVVAALTIALAFAGDMARRASLGQGLQPRVLEYWVGAVVASLLVGGLGGVNGRRLAWREWARRQLYPQ